MMHLAILGICDSESAPLQARVRGRVPDGYVTQGARGASLKRPWAFNKACSRTRGMLEHVFGVIEHL